MPTNIAWTEETLNPVKGCTAVSPGCANCYAAAMASRIEAMGTVPAYEGLTVKGNSGYVRWVGKLDFSQLHNTMAKLDSWKKARRVFLGSMTDLFHEQVSDTNLNLIFEYVIRNPRHTVQVLTKRPARARAYFEQWERRDKKLPKNFWLGVSAENNEMAQLRIPILMDIPAATRFVSYEPALGAIEWDNYWAWTPIHNRGIQWVVYGGESGKNYRPHNMEWAAAAHTWCYKHRVAFFYKQGNGQRSGQGADQFIAADGNRYLWQEYPGGVGSQIHRFD